MKNKIIKIKVAGKDLIFMKVFGGLGEQVYLKKVQRPRHIL